MASSLGSLTAHVFKEKLLLQGRFCSCDKSWDLVRVHDGISPAHEHPAPSRSSTSTPAVTPDGDGRGREGRGHQEMVPGGRSEGDVLLTEFRVSMSDSVRRNQKSTSPVATYFSLRPTLSLFFFY